MNEHELLKESLQLSKEILQHYTREGYELTKRFHALEERAEQLGKEEKKPSPKEPVSNTETEPAIIAKPPSKPIPQGTTKKPIDDLPF